MTWEELLDNAAAQKYIGQIKTDIKCPKCGRNIYYDATMELLTYPAKYSYWCSCGWADFAPIKWELKEVDNGKNDRCGCF